ncbi:MAG: hypothetical protein MAG795_00692 [Candidatus Woesearchaeota archaeon]|nr:hypothetical protein [Candidatus Woesearchaeota archaeon]
MTVALESIMGDIADYKTSSNRLEQKILSIENIIDSIDRSIDMRFINKRSIEISPKYLQRLKQDRGYRKLVKKFMKYCPGYEHMDGCLEYSAKTLELIAEFNGKSEDAVSLLDTLRSFSFEEQLVPFKVFHIFEELSETCGSRNDFNGGINYFKEVYSRSDKKEGHHILPGYSNLPLDHENIFHSYSRYKKGEKWLGYKLGYI